VCNPAATPAAGQLLGLQNCTASAGQEWVVNTTGGYSPIMLAPASRGAGEAAGEASGLCIGVHWGT